MPEYWKFTYDDLGDLRAVGVGANYPIYAANVFKAQKDGQIKSVGYFTTDNNTKYEIYVFNDLGTSKPSTPFQSGASPIASSTETYAGYHTLDISKTLKVTAGHYFSVVVKMTTPNFDYPIAVETPISYQYKRLTYVIPVINAGESYISTDGSSWDDAKYVNNGYNACIKVFTTNSTATSDLKINGTFTTTGKVGTEYSSYVTISGGTEPYTATYSGNVPTGLTFSKNGNKIILKGTPTTAGSYTFTLYATDDDGIKINKSFTVTVSSAPTSDLKFDGTFATTGEIGTEYSSYVTISGGTEPYRAGYNGNVPTGLSLSKDENKILLKGTPTTEGSYTFTLYATDSNSVSINKSFTVTISKSSSKPVIKISGTMTAKGTVGASFTGNLTASGGTSYTWKKASGTLPTGLKLSSTAKAKVILSGEPSKAGKFTFTLRVTDASGVTADKKCTVTIAPKISGTITTKGTVGTSYTANLTASGGTSYTWKKQSGTLPTGLKLSSTSKAKVVLSGTPAKAGKFTFTLRVTDESGVTADKKCTVTIAPKVAGTITAKGTVGTSYTANLTASGGTSYTWKKQSGTLPTGLKLSSTAKAKVVLSGTPTKAGKFTFTLRVTDTSGVTADKKCTVTIAPKVAGTITAKGTVGTSYTANLTASGGTSYTWKKASGTLPTGLKLSSTSKAKVVLSGTPTKAGEFNFTLRVTDESGATADKKCTVTITEKPLAFSGTLKDATLKKAYTGTIKVTGGTSPYKWSISGISGTIPSDLEFWPDENIMEITCKPTKTGSFSFTLKVKDKNSKTLSKKFTVKVVNVSTSKSASSQSEAENSENVESVETPSEISLNNKTFTFENEKSKDESSYFKINENIIQLEILSDDILWRGEGKDEDLIGVRINEPVRFIREFPIFWH